MDKKKSYIGAAAAAAKTNVSSIKEDLYTLLYYFLSDFINVIVFYGGPQGIQDDQHKKTCVVILANLFNYFTLTSIAVG